MDGIDWIDEPRTTVECIHEPGSEHRWLQGVEAADKDRANVFGIFRNPEREDGFDEDDSDEDDPDLLEEFDEGGQYWAAGTNSPIVVEAEVRFAFYESANIDDHAEVYVWQIYYWELTEGGAICCKDETFGGDYVVEMGGLHGPESLFDPLVGAAIRRIRDARWNKIPFEPRTVGDESKPTN